MSWRHHATNQYSQVSRPLKRKCHFDEIFTCCTESCNFDEFRCCHWRKFHQNYNITVSVYPIWHDRAWKYDQVITGPRCTRNNKYLHKHRFPPAQLIDKELSEVPEHQGPHTGTGNSYARSHGTTSYEVVLNRHHRCHVHETITDTWQRDEYILTDWLLGCVAAILAITVRHNERDGVSNHRRLDCLFNHLFRRRSKKISKPRVPGLCEGNPPVTGGFPSQRASNAENVFIWWRHHA